jgi:glutamyl-tRNA synthetase
VGGRLILRVEDLDPQRCRPEFAAALREDLSWFGFAWDEGPDVGGPFAPYEQSRRAHLYRDALARLQSSGAVYPCTCSRKDIATALAAPHAGEEEPMYPGTCRQRAVGSVRPGERANWRFRIPDGEAIEFADAGCGPQRFTAGTDFGDFVVWRHDDVPSYQLAVVVDDAGMQISEVVRGADLLLSTARQILLYRALHWPIPAFYHCPLLTDAGGVRLAKRHDSLSLRALRAAGNSPETLRAAVSWAAA